MQSQGGLEGRNDTQGEERGKKDGGRLQREKKDKIAEGIWNLSLPSCVAPSDPPATPLPLLLFQVIFVGLLQILVFVFEGAAACGDSIGGLLRLLVLFHLQDLTEEPEDGVETHPGGQLMPLCAYM